MKRWYVLGPAIGVAAGLIAFAFGVQGWRPILLGIVVGGLIIWAPGHWPDGVHMSWPRQPDRLHGGGSSRVSHLANRLAQHARRDGASDPGLQHRLRTLAIARLHRLGIAWDDARAPELLGRDVHALLTADTFTPDLDRVEHIVTAIERLGAPAGDGRRDPRQQLLRQQRGAA